MPDRTELTYCYDGSFEGFLCCVFESYAKKEIPLAINGPDAVQTTLFANRQILTDTQKANRVLTSIPGKMGTLALDFIRRAFLTCHTQKELYILLFLRLGYQHGPAVMDMLANEVVNTLFKAVKHLEKEAQLLKGLLRFSIFNNILVAQIEPKNCVLPLLARHFCERFPEEGFLIYDKTHGMGLVYQPYQSAIIPIDSLELPQAGEEEESFRKLWRTFYDTIAIHARKNPKCRMSHMPKRYWKYLTEFDRPQTSRPKLTEPSGGLLLTTPAIGTAAKTEAIFTTGVAATDEQIAIKKWRRDKI